MKIAFELIKKGKAFDEMPKRVLFRSSEKERKAYYSSQFSLLIKYWDKIPWRQWGVGSSKDLSELLRQIGAGEITLVEENMQLIRHMEIIIVFVFYKDKWLVEDSQVMADGRIRNRRFPYVSETLRLGEDAFDTAIRALKEESGGFINANKNKLITGSTTLLDENHLYNTGSSSYPGLKSVKRAHTFAYFLEKSEYKPKYLELDITGTTTIHKWKKISENYWLTGTDLEKRIKSKLGK